jgi:hypothetical protein
MYLPHRIKQHVEPCCMVILCRTMQGRKTYGRKTCARKSLMEGGVVFSILNQQIFFIFFNFLVCKIFIDFFHFLSILFSNLQCKIEFSQFLQFTKKNHFCVCPGKSLDLDSETLIFFLGHSLHVSIMF